MHPVGSLAIATASTRDSFDREGPPTVYNRSCRLRPPSLKRKFAGGDINPLGKRIHATSGFGANAQIEQVERDDWIEWTNKLQ